MKRAKRSTTLAVLACATAGHVLLLAMLALERPDLRWRIGSSDQKAVEITLAAPALPPPHPMPNPPGRRPPPPASTPTLPSILPPAPPQPSAPAAAELPNLARPIFRVWPRPLPGGVNWGAAEDGCDDPAHHLTPEQRERCGRRWASPPQQIAEIAPMIDNQGKIEFDRRIHCRDVYTEAQIPNGPNLSWRERLGRVPNFKECPPGDR